MNFIVDGVLAVVEPAVFLRSAVALNVSSNFASADFRKIKTYNFRKSESYRFQKLRNLQISEIKSRQVVL